MTYKDATDLIAICWNTGQHEKTYTSEEIYNYSPAGELFMIPEWLARAVDYFDAKGTDDEEVIRLMSICKPWIEEFVASIPK